MGEVFDRIHMLLKHDDLNRAEVFVLHGDDGSPEAKRVLEKARQYQWKKSLPATHLLERMGDIDY